MIVELFLRGQQACNLF